MFLSYSNLFMSPEFTFHLIQPKCISQIHLHIPESPLADQSPFQCQCSCLPLTKTSHRQQLEHNCGTNTHERVKLIATFSCWHLRRAGIFWSSLLSDFPLVLYTSTHIP